MKERLEYQKYKELKVTYERIVSRFSNIRMILFIVMIVSFILKYYYYPIIFKIIFFLSLVSFFIMVLIHDKYFKIYDYYTKYLEVLDTYLDRENGNWKLFSDKGEDFCFADKIYLKDLDIIGDCSLFQYLSICKTLGGRERLMDKLSNQQLSKSKLCQEQEMIEELVSNPNFCIKFQVKMKSYSNKDIHLTKELEILSREFSDKRRDFIVGIIASLICICFFLLGCFHIISFSYFYGMFLFNLLISFSYVYIFKDDFLCLDKMLQYYAKLVDAFLLVSHYDGKCFKMKKICQEMESGLGDISCLNKLDNVNSLRNNFLSNFILNGFGCLNLFVMYEYSSFLKCSYDNFKKSVGNIEELEAMISLANIGIVKRKKCMPKVCDKIGLCFKELKHPLLDEDVFVGNDFDTKAGVHIITGSNMGGKTTFLRTIGINLILMQAGTYACADFLESSYFKIFTSIHVLDNIDKGISTFYGELLRIKDMISYVNRGNMLVLIDEIFKGTNYNDRMYGAKEVVCKLHNQNTVAFITTHDFELCESDGVYNYHVKEDYEGDRIIFDYKIRTGKCSSTNAKYLMKKLGIID